MVIQTKLIFSNTFIQKEISLTPDRDWLEPLFQFSEYGRCQLTLEQSNPSDKLVIEYMNEGGFIELYPQQSILIADNSTDETGYVPGNFSIQWHHEGQIYEGFFTVEPQSLNLEDLTKLRECLESRVTGITRNLYSQKLVNSDLLYSQDSLHLITLLTQHYHQIVQALKHIEQHPIELIENRYGLTKQSKKPTVKSFRWNETKGSQHCIQNTQQVFYEPKKFLNLDIPENRYLKYLISDLLTRTTRLNEQYHLHANEIKERIRLLQTDIARLEESKQYLTNPQNMKKHRGVIEHEIEVKMNEVEDYKKRLQRHDQCFQPIRSLNAIFLRALNETWLRDVSSVSRGMVSHKLLKHRSYAYLYLIYQELDKIQQAGLQTPSFPYHQTSKLFEYYNVLLFIDLLKQQGFDWIDGWLMSLGGLQHSQQFYALNAEEELRFKHANGFEIKLSYDKFLKSASEAHEMNEAQVVSVNSNSRRPDILLELFNPQREFKGSMIVEVKYRKLNNLYQERIETDVMKQLIDYRGLEYYNPNSIDKLSRNAVNRIIVTYPKHRGSQFVSGGIYNFKFIPISPTDFDLESEGTVLIKEELSDFLNAYM